MDKDRYLQRAIDYHGLKYKYKNIPERIDLESYVTVECQHHGDFTVLASAHIRGSGCEICPSRH